jgi:hypothetical protein
LQALPLQKICSADQFWEPYNLLFDVYLRLGNEGDHTPPFSAKVNNEVTSSNNSAFFIFPLHYADFSESLGYSLKMVCSHEK